MNVSSDSTSIQSNRGYSITISTLSYLVHIVGSSTILAMSYGKMLPDYTIVLCVYALMLLVSNLNFSKMSKSYLQRLEDNIFQTSLKEQPLLSPISILLSFVMFGTLLTGNMYAWGSYIIYLIVITVISKAHKSRLGIVEKS